jgi:hypothetical protein
MAEATRYTFTHKEVVESLIKRQGLHEGLWMLYVEFGLGAINTGPAEDQIVPAAVVPIVKMGLQKGEKENALTVDAAKMNPAST